MTDIEAQFLLSLADKMFFLAFLICVTVVILYGVHRSTGER